MTEHDVAPSAGPPAERVVYLLAMPDLVLFPNGFIPVQIGDADAIRTVDAAFSEADRRVAVVAREAPAPAAAGEPPPPAGPLREYGTLALIPRMRRQSDGSMHLLLHGQERIRVVDPRQAGDVPARCIVVAAPDEPAESDTIVALTRQVQQTFSRMSELIPQANEEMVQAVETIDSPLDLIYLLSMSVRMEASERYGLLAEASLEQKLRALLRVLQRELELLELGSRLQSEAASEISASQREYFLRQQLKAIRDELGEGDESDAELQQLRAEIEAAALPEEADKTARRELRRLEQIPQQAAEHHGIRTYLELILALPWHGLTPDNLDLKHARRVLDEDHYGLEEVKERILDYLAVRHLKADLRGPILCFVGPPGVGKTSLGRSIARALGRKFARISLGGVHDEAEIRGHRRTYIGAMPGRIIEHLRRCEARNPVFVLDEIEKVNASLHGDPSSALLEVLDPAQNSTFRDNYLDLDFDLSRVLFIATANLIQTIQPALRDRLEIIEIPGYTEAEKLAIAKRFLLPRQRDEHGLTAAQMTISTPALKQLITGYTRESGVRNLERTIATVCRKAARRIADGEDQVTISKRDLDALLGPVRVQYEVAQRTQRPGVVTGLSVTATGGEVLFVEALRMPGQGQLKLTGQLGDVMKESAEAAFSYLRANADSLGVDPHRFKDSDFHLHVPAGAIPKDGPSAGITMATALLSALREDPADGTLAMTGELTLTGHVLPIGGVKEKLLAARRAGIERVLLPARNRDDLRDLPKDVRAGLTIVCVEHVDEVFRQALNGGASL